MGRKELTSQKQDDVLMDDETMPTVREDMINQIKQGVEQDFELPSVEQPKQRTIQNISLIELKAFAFDIEHELEDLVSKRNTILEELSRRSKAN